MAMACPDENRLVEFVDGRLPAANATEVDHHVDVCQSCRVVLACFARTYLDGGDAHAVEPDGDEIAPGGAVDGRYLVLDTAGAGAMSVVYAVYDRELDRKVALKLLRPVGDSPGGNRRAAVRVMREAQAMARLAHPNVLSVHDVGTLGDRVYFTAELVEGRTLAAWLAERRRPWREIVEVFVQAGRGLAAAHAAGVVHRDFKPANVLIGDDGRVRVADFGLARRAAAGPELAPTGGRPFDLAAGATGTAIVGTPAYMAPEQHAGGAADERSDQFAFGVALWEAVHGVRPFPGPAVADLAAQAAAGAPRRGGRRRRWPAALDRVLARTLHPQPERRYPSMRDVVDELERTRRRRRRGVVVALAASAAVACAGVVTIASGAFDPCRDAAVGPEWWTDAARGAMARAFAAASPGDPEAYARAARALDDRAAAIRDGRRDACTATHVEHRQSALLLDRRMLCLDRRAAEVDELVALLVDAPDAATATRAVDAAFALPDVAGCADAAALAAREPLPADPALRARVASAQQQLAAAVASEVAGRLASARQLTRAALAEAREIGWLPLVAETRLVDARQADVVGDLAGAEAGFRDGMVLAAEARDDRLVALAWIGLMEVIGTRQRRAAEAMALTPAVDAAVARAGGGDDLRARRHKVVGQVLAAEGRLEQAEEQFRRGVELARLAFGADSVLVADWRTELGEMLRLRGRLDEALTEQRESLAVREREYGPDHPTVGASHMLLGTIAYVRGDAATARRHYERALAIYERVLPAAHPDLAGALMSVGVVALDDGDHERALALYRRAGDIYRVALGDDHPKLASVENVIGEALRRRGTPRAALARFERALAIARRSQGGNPVPVAGYLMNSALALSSLDRCREAEPRFRDALAMFRAALGPDALPAAHALIGLGECALVRGAAGAAVSLLEEALAVRERVGVGGFDLAESQMALARALWRARPARRARARSLAEAAREGFAANGGAQEARDAAAWLAASR
jgi:tetratricopeptide (TPR) repeat protein